MPPEISYYATPGSTAHLECAIQPGVLTTKYFVTWKNASSNVDLISLAPYSLQTQLRTNERYSIAQNDFSLLIEDVRPSDAGTYLCVLGVSGADGFHMEYHQTRYINLTLQLLGR